MNQLHFYETTKLTISQVGFISLLCLKAIKHGSWKKILVYACDFHHWHFCDTSNLEPYTSVWVLTVVGAWEYHHTDQKTGVPSSARWLCVFAPFVTSDYANHFLVAAISLHYWVDVTLSQSKGQCLLTSLIQTTQVNFLLLPLSASQLHIGKDIVTTSQQFASPPLGKWKQFLI